VSSKPPPISEPPGLPASLVVLAAAAGLALAVHLCRPAPARYAEYRLPSWRPGEEVTEARTGKRVIWPGQPKEPR
jgi:hypothetical protein